MEIIVNRVASGMSTIPEGSSVQQTVPRGSPPEQKEKLTSKPGDSQAIQELTEKIQKHLDRRDINIAFSTYGKRNEKISITVTDKETGKVIREVPPEELQRLSAKMDELMGMIFNDLG
jgi:flagellar protein FlaG